MSEQNNNNQNLSEEERRELRRNQALVRQARLREKAAKDWDLSDGLKNAYECPEVGD